jgi:hypothetical protein
MSAHCQYRLQEPHHYSNGVGLLRLENYNYNSNTE